MIANKPELVLPAHEGLVCALQRSPFFKDIVLSIGGWTFSIWKEGVSVSLHMFSVILLLIKTLTSFNHSLLLIIIINYY